MDGPFEVDLKVRMLVGDQIATVTYEMPAGKYPTREGLAVAVQNALAGAKRQLGKGAEVRLLTRAEFQNEILAERTGHYVEYAAPGDWDDDLASAIVSRAAIETAQQARREPPERDGDSRDAPETPS